ncbi:MAG: winged helix-turn-helix domain-containing protein [Woeseiaceae bacterium]|nr:winged helix-turn-helix domain-containing protein [Woeseiaceae bacterium]
MLSYTDLQKGFEFGPWTVLPERDLIRNGDQERHLEPLVMDVFVVLASHHGDVVTRDQLVQAVWDGRPQADEVITRCISALRRNLGDNARQPIYIETLQKRGYRVMQRVRLPDAQQAQRRFTIRPLHAAVLALIVAAIVALGQFTGREPSVTDTHIDSVAVFPFECKQDATNPSEHLCFGFAEEAISGLKRIDGLRVIRMRLPYSGTPPDRVDGIVTGSVQIIDGRVRIAAFLEDTRSGLAICCDTFDATQRNIFDAQKQVAHALSQAINANSDDMQAAQSSPSSFEAEMAYSLGRFFFEKRDQVSMANAIEHFERAIELDRSYGAAYLGLAYTYVNWPDYDLSVDRDAMYDKALEVIGAGIAADPGIREAAGTVYGFVFHKRNDWLTAQKEFEMATAAAIEQPIAYHWYSYLLASVGRLDAALENALLALQLDPDNPSTMSRVAILALFNNDLASAERYFEMASLMGLENYQHSLAHALLRYREGRFDEAKASGRQGLMLNGADASWFDLIIDGSWQPELRPVAIETLDAISSLDVLPANIEMFFWMLLQEVDRALQIARRLQNEVGVYELELVFTDEFEAMRRHPEFGNFLESIGLAEYWTSTGCVWGQGALRCQ